MPTLNRQEIRNRAYVFIKEWQGETREHAEAQSFWGEFFNIFGVSRRRVASFERPLKKADGTSGRADLLWPGKLLIEHKSAGKNLDKAYQQALNYFPGLKEAELPRYVLVSDFARFSLHDLDNRMRHDFSLVELPDNIHLFDFIAGHEDDEQLQHKDLELNVKASLKLGALYDALKASQYTDHALKIFLVRILFCLFAEDTGIFARHQFVRYLIHHTAGDGSDTDMHLGKLFQVLDTPESQRSPHLSEELAAFPYVNGHLFTERIDMPSFNAEMHEVLIEATWFDWSGISPAIFGSLFQGVMEKQERRAAGAHYTSEANILRLIGPLFLDELRLEMEHIHKRKSNKQKLLIAFQQKLSQLHFFDPACGCGNFLIVTYRELRRLELWVLREQHGKRQDTHLALDITPLIKLEHFHGIEIDEWPVRIAEVAMWLTQHQMNREFARQFGREPDLLPLKSAAHIINGNALVLDWGEVLGRTEEMAALYLLGNPPFVGKNFRSTAQNAEMMQLFKQVKNYKSLDYVTCWFYKAAQFMQQHPAHTAFVATNSITQGEQVAPLWGTLLALGMQINFAHRTFAWQSEARGKAAVHVVIVGFSPSKLSEENKSQCRLFEYPDIKGEPVEIAATNINPYLVDAPNIVIENRIEPLCNVSIMVYGNKPVDGGHLLLSPQEKADLLQKQPQAEKWLRPLLGAEEFINGKERWCLWLVGISPAELRAMPEVVKRVEGVKQMRLASPKEATKKRAATPHLFGENRHPKENYILVPSVSSECREYVPIGFFDSNTISTNANLMIPNASIYEFGILESKIHITWMRAVCGRLKSDFRYSAKLVYNNFPWPEPNAKQKIAVEQAAQAILDIRTPYLKTNNSFADLYDPLTMPADLRKAHQKLDTTVDSCY
ncbi:methylase, partial [Achromatium sp. WMS3]